MLNTPLFISETSVEVTDGIPKISARNIPDFTQPAPPIMYANDSEVKSYSEIRPPLSSNERSLIGIISVYGGLYKDGYYDSYDRIASQFRQLNSDPAIRSIVMRVHSPGGTADGCSGLADVLTARSKPLIVHGSRIHSAAYFISSPADLIVIDTSAAAQVGSIGCLMIHHDYSKQLENEGISTRIFRANGSEQKALTNSYESLTEAAAFQMQKVVDECRAEFVGYVNRGRARKLKSEALTGLEFSQKEAMQYGLVDHIGSFEWTLKKAATFRK